MLLNRRVVLLAASAAAAPWRARAADDPVPPQAQAPNAPPPAQVAKDGFALLEAKAKADAKATADSVVWAYNGEVPGPVLRLKKGAELKIRFVNALAQPSSLSVQGMRGPNAMDGVAGLTQPPVKPGDSFDYRFVPPDSGLFWYHAHTGPWTAEQTGRGLYGVLIVDEADPPHADDELVAIIGTFPNPSGPAAPKAPALCVNAKALPMTNVLRPGSRVRLRLVNAAPSDILVVTFEGVHPQIMAIDGQPCDMFEPVRQTVPIGPGARFDVMFDLPSEAAKEVRLVSRGDGTPDQTLLLVKTAGEPRKPGSPITGLPASPALPTVIPLERAFKMDVVIGGGVKAVPSTMQPVPVPAHVAVPAPVAQTGAPADPAPVWTINGIASEGFAVKPLFKVKRGGAVSLSLVNKTALPQQISIRGHAVRLLHDLDDGWEPYWRDAVLIAPGRTKHVAFIANNPGKWALESSILDRQVAGLATWFEVA